jgi:uncharacterized protein YndB with AHSA1/START domain
MSHEINLERNVPLSKEVVFRYWVDPRLLELWSSPQGLTLEVPYFQAEKSGKYCFKHTGEEGVYVCEGVVRDIIPNKKLEMIDHVKDPNGNVLFDHLESTVHFEDSPLGTLIKVRKRGFQDEKSRKMCEQGWTESLDKLSGMLSHIRWRPGQELRDQQVRDH